MARARPLASVVTFLRGATRPRARPASRPRPGTCTVTRSELPVRLTFNRRRLGGARTALGGWAGLRKRRFAGGSPGVRVGVDLRQYEGVGGGVAVAEVHVGGARHEGEAAAVPRHRQRADTPDGRAIGDSTVECVCHAFELHRPKVEYVQVGDLALAHGRRGRQPRGWKRKDGPRGSERDPATVARDRDRLDREVEYSGGLTGELGCAGLAGDALRSCRSRTRPAGPPRPSDRAAGRVR